MKKNTALTIAVAVLSALVLILVIVVAVMLLQKPASQTAPSIPPATENAAPSSVPPFVPESVPTDVPSGSETSPAATDLAIIGSLPASGVSKLDIDWSCGSITIVPADTDQIVFYSTPSQQYPTVYEQEGQELEIKFSRTIIPTAPPKELLVTVPRNWNPQELSVDGVDSAVKVSDLTVGELDIGSVSGTCTLTNISALDVSLETVSGNMEFSGSASSLECDSVSARIQAALVICPRRIQLDSASGQMDLTLPADSGFQVNYETLSGEFTTDFPVSQSGRRYVCGDGSCMISQSGISGILNISMAK